MHPLAHRQLRLTDLFTQMAACALLFAGIAYGRELKNIWLIQMGALMVGSHCGCRFFADLPCGNYTCSSRTFAGGPCCPGFSLTSFGYRLLVVTFGFPKLLRTAMLDTLCAGLFFCQCRSPFSRSGSFDYAMNVPLGL